MKTYFKTILIVAAITMFSSCKQEGKDSDEEQVPNAKVPVTLCNISVEPISEAIELRGTSQFQKKVAVKANATGYINNITVNIGDDVSLDQLLFTIKTKEASAIDNQKTNADTSLNFTGVLKIKAQKSGIITTLDHQKGDYVQDGDQLGIISERNSLVFILEVPYEMHDVVKLNGNCEIVLTDNNVIKGIISKELSSVDPVAQTQSYVVKPLSEINIPENLIAKIRIIKNTKENAIVLPKSAILADETQTEFWVMKLINDSTAIKVSVKKGIETKEKVEILEPEFNEKDRIIFTGNYGLADTAKISVEKK